MLHILTLCAALSSPAPLAVVTAGVVTQVADPAAVPLPDNVPTLEETPGLVMEIVQSGRERNWQLMVALIVMLIVALANRLVFGFFDPELKKKLLPWFAAGTGCLLAFATVLLTPGASWWSALLAGFVTGAAAVGLWELVGKAIAAAFAKKPSP